MHGEPPVLTHAILPLELTQAELAEIDRRAAACGMTRQAFIADRVTRGLDLIEAGHPLPPIDTPENDTTPPPSSGPRAR